MFIFSLFATLRPARLYYIKSSTYNFIFSIKKKDGHEVVFNLENNCRVEFIYCRYFFFLIVFSFISNNTSLENSLYWFDLILCTITCEFWVVFFVWNYLKFFVFLFSIHYVNVKIIALYTRLIMCKLFKVFSFVYEN